MFTYLILVVQREPESQFVICKFPPPIQLVFNYTDYLVESGFRDHIYDIKYENLRCKFWICILQPHIRKIGELYIAHV